MPEVTKHTKFLSPTDAAALIGCEPGTLRSYARRGIVNPITSSSGRRMYTQREVIAAKAFHARRRGGASCA